MKFIRRRASLPPLGLLTIAAILPVQWKKRLVDVNVRELRDADLEWADLVLISAMIAQRKSAVELIARCRDAGKKIVAGGPLFTVEPEDFPEVDHLVLNEAEVTLPEFLKDFAEGNPRRVYTAAGVMVPTDRWQYVRYHLPGLAEALRIILSGENPKTEDPNPPGVPTPPLPAPRVMPEQPLLGL